MNEQKPTLHELLRKFARLRGLPIEEKPNGLVCRIDDKKDLKVFLLRGNEKTNSGL